GGEARAEAIRDAVHRKDADTAERDLALAVQTSPEEALNELLHTVQDQTEVHRVVLPYRAWDLLDLIGKEHAHTLLRQSVRYCVKAESYTYKSKWEQPSSLVPRLLEQHKLLDQTPGQRLANDKQ